MPTPMEELQAQVTASRQAEESALILIQGLVARLANCGEDPAKVRALTQDLKASQERLAAAVAANTPGVTPA